MDKMDKPLSDWTLGETRELCINQSSCKGCPMSGVMCFIDKPVCPQEWILTDKPRFTEEEVADAKKIGELIWDAEVLTKYANGVVWILDQNEKEIVRAKKGLFPSLRPGQSVRLEDVLGE